MADAAEIPNTEQPASLEQLDQTLHDARFSLDAIRTAHTEAQQESEAVSMIHAELSTLLEGFRNSSEQITQDALLVQKTKTTTETANIEVNTLKGQITAHAEDIRTKAEQARAHSTTISDIAQRADTLEQRLNTQQVSLQALEKRNQELLEKLEGLLPGATSAGLASSYRLQKEIWSGPRKFWAATFLLAMVALFSVAFINIGQTGPLTPENFLSYFLARLPYLIAPIWLALYAANKHTIAGRLQEEYRHKETTSMSFEGYKRQLEEIQKANQPEMPVTKFCETVIATLAVNPSRVFTERHPSNSPLSALSTFLPWKKEGDS